MKNSFTSLSGTFASLLAALTFMAASVPVHAQTATKPMALRGIMQQLSTDMQAATDAIAREDWSRVAMLAEKIAEHPEPPITEKVRILAWLATDIPEFRGFDEQAHVAGAAMAQAAENKDGQQVIANFAKVQQACLGCHQGYRQAFIERFYDKP